MILTDNYAHVIHSKWIIQFPGNERHCVGYLQSCLLGRVKSRCLATRAQKGKHMKKLVLMSGMLACVLAFGVETAHAQARSLDAAVQHVATEISFGVRAGATVALASVNSETFRMSNYLTNGLTEALLASGRVMLIDWTQQRDGVEYTIIVDFEPHADGFRLLARVTRVQGSVIQGTHSSIVMRNDPTVASLLGAAPVAAAGTGQAVNFGVPMRGGFTTGQRWATYWLNVLVPGLGSFLIMQDRAGGWFQVIMGYGGIVLSAAGMFFWPIIPVGGIMFLASGIVNIVRSATFSRDVPAIAAMPEQWNLAVIPGETGIGKVALTHTMRF